MEISEIESLLSLSQVLKIYLLYPDKNNMLRCPFHDDKTASLHVNLEKNYFTCYGCGKHGDQIEFVQEKDKLTKHEALLKCTQFIQEFTNEPVIIKTTPMQEDQNNRIIFLTKMFASFKNAIPNSAPAKDYLQSRNLDYKQLEIGYNGGQFHHGTRKDEHLINQSLQYGLLLDKGLKSNANEKAYSVFGKNGLVFPLKNQFGQIVSFYFRNILPAVAHRHFYLKKPPRLIPQISQPSLQKVNLNRSHNRLCESRSNFKKSQKGRRI
jgi:DNA primase